MRDTKIAEKAISLYLDYSKRMNHDEAVKRTIDHFRSEYENQRLKLRCIAANYGITVKQLLSKSRKKRLVQARVAAIREFGILGYGPTEIARILGLNHSTIIYHLYPI